MLGETQVHRIVDGAGQQIVVPVQELGVPVGRIRDLQVRHVEVVVSEEAELVSHTICRSGGESPIIHCVQRICRKSAAREKDNCHGALRRQ